MCGLINSRMLKRQPVVTGAKLGRALEINLAAGGPGSIQVEINTPGFVFSNRGCSSHHIALSLFTVCRIQPIPGVQKIEKKKRNAEVVELITPHD